MTDEAPVAKLLRATAEQMRIDFDKVAVLDHPGEKGRGREDALRAFLGEYLPGRFGVGTGFVVDATGRMSAQMDIVIFDQASAPVFKVSENVRLFPIESVAGVVQVKSFLDAKELESAVRNLATTAVLDRTAGGQQSTMAGGVMQPGLIAPVDGPSLGETLDAQGYLVENEPVLTCIFAFSSIDLGRLARRLKELSNDPVRRVPLACVLDRGLISWVRNGEMAPYNAYWSDARLAFTNESDKGLTLQLFYATLAYGVTRKAPIAPSFRAYAGLEAIDLQFVD